MERIAYKIALDVTKAESQKFLTGFSVGESRARVLKITLNNGRNPVHFDGTETISMFVTKPSDTSPSIGLCYLEGDTIVYNVLQSDVSEEGPTRFTIKVQHLDEDQNISVLYAAHFTIQVTDPECDDSHVPDDPNYSILEALIAEVEQFDSDAEAFAIGTRGGVPVDEDDPAYHNNAKYFAENLEYEVEEQVERAEAWADGTRGGVPVPETDPAYHNNAKFYKEQAATSATNAAASEINAAASELNASGSASSASADALKAEGFAVGEQGGTPVGETSPYYHNNAEFFKNQAATSATNAGNSETAASGSASNAAADALKAEGWAKGKQNGTDVGDTSPYYHNNAEYFKEQASQSATNAGTSETNAAASALAASGSATTSSNQALVAEGWAKGTQNGQPVGPGSPYYENNAEHFKNEAHSIVGDKVDSFNNRTGPVTSQKGDYGADKIEIDTTNNSLPNTLDTVQDFLDWAYPPGASVTLTINGAKEDVITIKDSNDATIDTCTFESGQTSGTITITVPVGGGTYKFISSVAKVKSGGSLVDYEKTVTLTGAATQTVNVYPTYAWYWFGNFVIASIVGYLDSSMVFQSGSQAVTVGTNSITLLNHNDHVVSPTELFSGFKMTNVLNAPSGSSLKVLGTYTAGSYSPPNTGLCFRYSANSNMSSSTGVDIGNSAKTGLSEDTIANIDTYNGKYVFLGEYLGDVEIHSIVIDNPHENDLKIKGAKEDTITITDSNNQTVATCVFGSGLTYGYVSKSLLPSGTYTFTSSVAKDTTTGTSDYSKTIVLDGSETEVDIYPEKALYWYGRYFVTLTTNNGTLTDYTNYFELYKNVNSNPQTVTSSTQIDFTSVAVKALANVSSGNTVNVGYGTSGSSGYEGAFFTISRINYGIDGASSAVTNKYLQMKLNGNSASARFKALWCE